MKMRTIREYLDNRILTIVEYQKGLQFNHKQEAEEVEEERWEKKQREERQQKL